jgi:hypothetical protein
MTAAIRTTIAVCLVGADTPMRHLSSLRRHHRAVTNDDEQGGHGQGKPRSIPRRESASDQRGRNIRQVQGPKDKPLLGTGSLTAQAYPTG